MCYKNEDMNKCNIIDIIILCIVSWQKISIKNTLLITLHRLALKKKIDVKKKEFLWGFEGSDV